MMEIGRMCVKIAGRDSNLKCVIVDTIDNNYVMIDGQTRRRKCNVDHLEPLDKVVKIKKGATHKEVMTQFRDMGIEIKEKKTDKKNSEAPSETVKKSKKKAVKKN